MRATIRIFCAVCSLMLCVSLQAQEKKEFPKEMLGNWITSVENPETGDTMKGSCVVSREGDVTKASFDMGMGAADTTPFRANDDGSFYADLDVGDFVLGIIFTIVEGKLTCEMDAGGFVIPVGIAREE